MILILDISTQKTNKPNIFHHLNELIRSFFSSQPEYMNKIEKVLLLNFTESKIHLKSYKEYLSWKNTITSARSPNSRFSTILTKLLSSIVILNFSEIFPDNGLKLISSKKNIYFIQNLNIDLIKEIIGNSKSIFLCERMNPIFAQVLLSLDELVGYYRGLKGKDRWSTEISEPKRFLEILINLNRLSQKLFDVHPNFENFRSYLDLFINRKIDKNKNKRFVNDDFYNKFKMYSGQKNSRIFLYDGDTFLSDKFRIGCESKQGKFAICDCIGDNLSKVENATGYYFDNIDALSWNNRLELLNFIQSEPLKNCTVILRSSSSPEDALLLNFIKIDVPAIEMVFSLLPMFFYKMLKEKKIILGKEVIGKQGLWIQYLTSSALVNFYRSLNSLYELDLLIDLVINQSEIIIDPGKPDFWYELMDNQKLEFVRQQLADKKLKLNRAKQVIERNPYEIDEENKEPIELTFIYDETVDEDNWIITSNLFEEVRTISYDSLGTKIMAYLMEFPSSKKIDAIELREKIKPYYGREYKPQKKKAKGPTDPMRNAYNSMRGAAKYDLKKLFAQIEGKDQLVKRVLKCFNFSIKCYYKENANVNVILKFNDPSLLNYPPTN